MAISSSSRVYGMLVGDQGDAAIPGSAGVLLVRDLDGDGIAASPGEVQVFFDVTNASGLVSPAENVFTIHQAADGSVFIGDGDTDSIYRLTDLNGDGDANDAGEAAAWFTPANAGGFSTVTPNGVAEGSDGAIYITNAGVSSAPADMIYRTVDLNGDGHADDEGEATVWADLQTVIPTSVPFDITLVGDVAYVSDLTGAVPDVIHRLEDTDGNGQVEAGEIVSFATDTGAFGAPVDIAIDQQDGSILSLSWTASGGQPHRLYRLADLDGNGVIDQAEESIEVWNSTYLPEWFSQQAGFSVAAAANGSVALAVNGSGDAAKNVYLLTDMDGDGLYQTEGETVVFASHSYDDGSLHRPRTVEFYNDLDLDGPTRGTAEGESIRGTSASETILGLGGDDTLIGGAGNDELWGGLGDDTVNGGGGDDLIYGNNGDDLLVGGAGNDELRGGEGIDQLKGGTGDDVLKGEEDDDRLVGGDGDDILDGGAGADLLFGGAGADRLLGGAGSDRLSGGDGADTFVFGATDGASERDFIIDFELGMDRLELDGLTILGIKGNAVATRVTFDNGSEVTLRGVDAGTVTVDGLLEPADIVFV